MDDSRTVFCGNLPDELTEELLYELFLQVAPLERVKIPTDKEGRKSNFGFVTFKHEISVPYAVEMLNGIKLFERPLTVKPRKPNSQRNDSPLPMNIHMPHSYDERVQQYNQYAGYSMMNQHVRFNDYGDSENQMNCEEVLRLQQVSQMLQGHQDFSNPYSESPGRHSNWHDRERDNFRGRDIHFRDMHSRGSDEHRGRNDHRGHNRRHDRDRRDYSNNRRSDHDHHGGGHGRRRY